jgi:REP element-mobilizing transposase RayT
MPRKKRIWYEGATFHVMGRGNRRTAVFKTDEDYRLFLKLLETIKERYPFDLHAFCLMTNHFHLEITTGEDPIWKIMQPLMNHYARNFNQRYDYTGHLFESRYTSCLIEDERYFLEVSRYIHLNPVKAQMVREPRAYSYSSYKNYVSDEKNDFSSLLETERVLGAFHRNDREQYRMFVEGKISHAEQELLIQKDIGEDEQWLPW